MRILTTPSLALCIAISATCLHSEPLAMVQDGKGLPIIQPAHASETERFAAEELSRYLQKITGQPFEIRSAAAPPKAGLFIGRRFAESIGISFSQAELGDEGFILKRIGGRVVLAGISDRGTLYAVYAFLQQAGCRWFAPNFDFYGAAGGEFVPTNASFAVNDLDIREKPAFRWRKKYVEEGRSHTTENLKQLIDWMAKARFNVFDCPLDYQHEGRTKWDNWRQSLIPELKKRGMLIEVGGHGYQNFLPAGKYFAQHPEWFGMQDGKRSSADNVVFSTANEEAVRTFIANVKDYLRQHPEVDIFDCWPPDGSRWSDAPEDLRLGSPSERQILLLNRLAKALAGEFPKLRVQFLAYESYTSAPTVNKPAPGVVMEFCPIDRSFESRLYADANARNTHYYWQLQGWTDGVMDPSDITIYSYITKYAWRSLPVLVPHLIADEARYFHEMGIGGQAAYSEPAGWATFELDHYIMARFSWDSELDVDHEIEDYARNRYGRAAAPMLQYLRLVEDVVPHAVAIPGTDLELAREKAFIAHFAKAEDLLKDAAHAAEGNPSLLMLIDKMARSRRYAENEMRLRLAFLEEAKGSRRDRMQTIENLLKEREQIVHANATTGVITEDQRLP